MKTIAVLGGGVAGLSAASELAARGHRPVVFEATACPGGFVRTEETGGWLIESGPNTLQWGHPDARALVERLRLEKDLVTASPAAKNRYVVHKGTLMPIPMSPPALLGSRLFSLRGKVKILSELLTRPKSRPPEATVAQVMREHFGAEALQAVVQPFVSGIFAGDPELLSFEHAFPTLAQMERERGSFIRGQIARAKKRRREGESSMPPLASFRHGLGSLVDGLVRSLPEGSLRLGRSVAEAVPGAGWSVRLDGESQPESLRFDTVLSTLPASGLRQLTISGAQPLRDLERIVVPPIASLFLGFRRDQVAHPLDGFGVLVPATERMILLGCIFSSSLFEGRAPEGHVALTCLAGGALAPEFALLEPDVLEARILPELRRLLGVTGKPIFRRHNAWPASIPQYAPGYDAVLGRLAGCEARHPGLFFGGMVRDGISLPSAISAGRALARRCCA